MNKFLLKPIGKLIGSTLNPAVIPKMMAMPKTNINFMFATTINPQNEKGTSQNKPQGQSGAGSFWADQNKDQSNRDQGKAETKDQDKYKS